MISAHDWAEKWAARTAGSGTAAGKGADRVTVSPGERAAQQKEKYRQRVLAALDSGETEAAWRSTSTEDWRKAFKEKGIPRMATGATAAKPKVQRFAEIAGPIAQQSSEQCAQMPNSNDSEALEIVRINMANMKKIRQQYRRR